MRVLVAGCGYVGGALAARLVAEGHDVWGLRRRVDRLPPGVRPIAADLTDASTLGRLPEGLDGVVYTASADASQGDAYREAYVAGPRTLAAALLAHGSEGARLLFTSSTAVYGQTDGSWVDEESPTDPLDFRGRTMLQAEREVLEGPFPAVVLRLGGIYGPGRDRLIREVTEGRARCLSGEPRWTNRIHRDDAASALLHLLLLPSPASVYLGVDDEPADRCDVLRWLAAELGVRPPSANGAEDPDASRRANKRCSSARLRASGLALRYPTYREGYRALIGAEGS